jgi:hypothetical protein
LGRDFIREFFPTMSTSLETYITSRLERENETIRVPKCVLKFNYCSCRSPVATYQQESAVVEKRPKDPAGIERQIHLLLKVEDLLWEAGASGLEVASLV